MKAEGDACLLTSSRCQEIQAANRKVSHVGSKNGSEVLFVEDISLGNIPSFGVKTNAIGVGRQRPYPRSQHSLKPASNEAGLWSVCMRRESKPCNAEQRAEQSQTVTILFKPDADRVSKKEVELVMSVFDEVLLAMKRIETDAAATKSSSFSQKVEPCAVSAIKGGRVHSKQGA